MAGGLLLARRAAVADAPAPALPEAKQLPAWPLLGYWWSFPVGWVLGLGPFLLPAWSAVMAAHLVLRGRPRVPPAVVTWVLFLATVVVSGLMIDTAGRAAGWLIRLGTYGGATVAMLYVFNAGHRVLDDDRILRALVAFWVWVVVGGWLGVLFPEGGLSTPVGAIMPGSLMSNELVRDLVNPNFAEVQQPWGSPVAFARPAAPFPYSNGWGVNYALLTIFAAAAWTRLRGRPRALLGVAMAVSMVPAALTLNRGMVLSLGIALLYVAARAALRGRLRLLAAIVIGSGVLLVLANVLGLVDLLELRTTYSSSTLDRSLVYRETFVRTLESPLVGWGGPRPSRTLGISVGTQGHVWNVMFSHGFVGLALFLSFLWWSAWRTRGCVGVAAAAHVVLVVVSIAVTYYGFDGPQMLTALVAAGIAHRQVASSPPAAEVGGLGGPRLPAGRR